MHPFFHPQMCNFDVFNEHPSKLVNKSYQNYQICQIFQNFENNKNEKDAHGFTDHFASAEKFIRHDFEG